MLNRVKKLLLYFIIFYAFIGFILIPFFVKPQIIKLVEQETNSLLKIDSLYFNPFIFKLSLDGVELQDLENSPLLSFKSFTLNLEPTSLVYGAIHISHLILEKPEVSLVYNKDKTINLLNIIKKSESVEDKNSKTSELPHIILESVEVVKGGVFYRDLTKVDTFEFSFKNIGFTLKNIDTSKSSSSDAQIRLYSTLGDGGFIDFRSEIEDYSPFITKGTLDFEASKLYTEWKYVKDELNLEVADGKISFHTDYFLNLDELNATKINNLNVELSRLRVKPKKTPNDVLNLERLYVKNTTVMPFLADVSVEEVGLKGLSVKAKRESNGTIDWIGYIQTKETNQDVAVDSTTEEKSQEWSVLVKKLSLEQIGLEFIDEAIEPNVTSKINELNIYAQDITLKGEKPLSYQLNMLINDTTECRSDGSVIHKNLYLKSQSSCASFDIVHYQPYINKAATDALKKYDLKLLNAQAGFTLSSEVIEEGEEIYIKVSDSNVSLEELRVNKKSTKERLLSLKKFSVNGINIDTKTEEISIAKSGLDKLTLSAARYKNGSLNVDDLVVPKKTKKSKKKKSTKKEKDFALSLKHFSLNNARVDFVDKALISKTSSKLDRIYFNAYDIDIKEKSWLSYRLSMRVNSKGTMKASGRLRHTPLRQKGTFDIKNISLISLTPYLQESSYVDVNDGRVSLKGRSSYATSSVKPDLVVKSSFAVDSLFINDSKDDSSLLSLHELKTDEFTLELSPNRLYVNELDINAFYVNAIIDENKSMNFSELSKTSEKEATSSEEYKDTNDSKKTDFPVQIAKVNVAFGSAKFADYSIPIKFATHIHDLDGVIYSISNTPGDTSYVNLTGEVDEYGSTRLKGSVDSSNPKLYTDLDFNFKNIELNAMSGYSATFAGHEIDSGKLYLDLGYDILNSQLKGSNSVMIKKVELGREIDDENVTVLPLGFVIGLLEDSDGVIDIDMPVEGNVDEPDFKYGALVWKTVGSLIADAVTSPFRFLGAMMGIDGSSLEHVEFEEGSDLISPPEREKLDQVAKIMLKKPKISLEVIGSFDEKVDLLALKRKKLIDLVMVKSGLKNRKEHESAMSIGLLEEIYEDVRDDDTLDKLQKELETKYEDDSYDRNYQKALIGLCTEIQVVSDIELVKLADSRSTNIFNYLTQEKSILAERVSKIKSVAKNSSDENLIQVSMEIKVK
ncbi:MAG: DUF748 domain-containing protein [Campylobacterota bacterium]|nr:DUF748 domain-containing protein [Campylobacterota bacterium]